MLAVRGIAGRHRDHCQLDARLYPLAYERCLRNVITSEGRTTGAMSRGWATLAARLLRPLLRVPLQRGLAAFMLATLGRSHAHRFLIGMYAGIAFLMALPIAGRLLQMPTTDRSRTLVRDATRLTFLAGVRRARGADDAGRAGGELDLQAHRAGG